MAGMTLAQFVTVIVLSVWAGCAVGFFVGVWTMARKYQPLIPREPEEPIRLTRRGLKLMTEFQERRERLRRINTYH